MQEEREINWLGRQQVQTAIDERRISFQPLPENLRTELGMG